MRFRSLFAWIRLFLMTFGATMLYWWMFILWGAPPTLFVGAVSALPGAVSVGLLFVLEKTLGRLGADEL